MILKTERTYLRKVTIKDAQFIIDLVNSHTWLKYIGDRNINNEESARAYINNSLIKSYKNNGYGLYIICLLENNKPIGTSGFVKRDYLEHPDVGFAVLPEYEGQGLIKEVTEEVMRYGKENLGFSTVYAITTDENMRSKTLLNKLGLYFQKNVKVPNTDTEFMLFSN